MTSFVLRCKPFERCKGFLVEDFWPAGALARVGGPSFFQSAKDIVDSGLSTADFICNRLIGIALLPSVQDEGMLSGGELLGHGGVGGFLNHSHCNEEFSFID